MYRAKPTDDEDILYLSPQSRELLRQVLRVEALDGESQLVGAVKEALRMQYSRGFHEGMAEGAKHSPNELPIKAPPWSDRRKLSETPYKNSISSAERRRHRRSRRLRRRLRRAMVTAVFVLMAGAALVAIHVAEPQLSASNPRARHRIDWYAGQ